MGAIMRGFIPAVAFALCLIPNTSSSQQDGWVTLFDGTSLEHWNKIGDANWALNEGAVEANMGRGFLVTKKAYEDFELRVEFWADADANSGVMIRCADAAKPGLATCYEVNIYDKRPDPQFGTGGIVNVAKVAGPFKADSQWHVFDISAKGADMSVHLNGTQSAAGADSKLPSGPIALQYGGGVVKFRKVQIRPL
jgi:hypothetical protein